MRVVSSIVIAFILVFILFVVSPITAGFVTSSSMEPVIEEGDVYFLKPAEDVEEGDIIAFYSPQKEELFIHRVVDETEQGYITQGDANDNTDQAVGFQPVKDAQIRGEVIEYNKKPLLVENGRGVISFFANNKPVILGLCIVILLLDFAIGSLSENRKTLSTPLRYHEVANTITFIAWVFLIVLFFLSANTVTFEPVVTKTGNGGTMSIGQEQTVNVSQGIQGVQSTMYTYKVVSNQDVLSNNQHKRSVNTTIQVGPYNTIGRKTAVVTYFVYPNTLPNGFVEYLHNIHPIIAITVTTGVVVIPLNLILRLTTPDTRVRSPKSDLIERFFR